jgi:hypothetical protein
VLVHLNHFNEAIKTLEIDPSFLIPELDTKASIEIAFKRGLTNFLPSLSFDTALNVGLLDVAF